MRVLEAMPQKKSFYNIDRLSAELGRAHRDIVALRKFAIFFLN